MSQMLHNHQIKQKYCRHGIIRLRYCLHWGLVGWAQQSFVHTSVNEICALVLGFAYGKRLNDSVVCPKHSPWTLHLRLSEDFCVVCG